ncbi:Alpha-adducin [Echinococcus granulosus]|nr:Alpha-adducin [Echinococcus granulosus]
MADAVVGNGFTNTSEKFIDNIDPDDPEYKRQLMRPAEIKEDLNLMSQRRRVSLILNSESFRKELEEIIENYTRSQESAILNSSLLSLQHLADLFSTIPGKRPLTGGGFTKSHQNGIIPINDLRGVDTGLYSRRERVYRCKLASVYRLIELFGWNTSIYNHATVRISRNEEHFLINPFGLLYHEVTASSLIKLNSHGVVLDPGSTVLGVEQAGWLFHSAVHSTRPDIRCIIHLGTPATVAVSCMKAGLLPLSQEAIILGEVVYYTPKHPLPDDSTRENVAEGGAGGRTAPSSLVAADLSSERAALSKVIAQDTHILFVRYRGLLALGETIEEAWHYATNAVVACETQLRLASLGVDHLVLPNQQVQKRTYEAWRTTELGGVSGPEAAMAIRLAHARTLSLSRHNASANGTDAGYLSDSSLAAHTASARPWRLGELEFEALMRHLDNAGYRTGHLYRQDAAVSPRPSRRTLDRLGAITGSRRFEDVEVPPFSSSAATAIAQYYDDVGAFSGDESETARPGTLRRQWSDQRWLNTPNNYTKEVSTLPGRQPVAHWVSSREASLHVEISSGRLPPPTPFHPLTPAAVPLGTTGAQSNTPSSGMNFSRFAPQGDDPRELMEHQKKVREKYYRDTNTAGPQSRLLEGLTWDEACRIRDEALVKALGPGAVSASLPDSHSTVAAASKAILHRDVRDGAVVYEGVYTKQNPFGQVTDEELEAYKQEIQMKNNPTLYAEWLRQQEVEQAKSPLDPTDLAQSPAVPICASSAIFSDSELHETTYVTGSHLSPPSPVGLATSEMSEIEDSNASEKKPKKKRRFKLPTLARKTRTKEKKVQQESQAQSSSSGAVEGPLASEKDGESSQK